MDVQNIAKRLIVISKHCKSFRISVLGYGRTTIGVIQISDKFYARYLPDTVNNSIMNIHRGDNVRRKGGI